MRKPIIVGNWKMNNTIPESISLIREITSLFADEIGIDVAVAPPFTALAAVWEEIRNTQIKLAAQNIFWEKKGAYTGEISAEMLVQAGCSYVIVGHSERRQYLKETDEMINKKLKTALDFNLIPILCIGESLDEREGGRTFHVIKRQIEGALRGIEGKDVQRMVIAYEPIWAIGTGKSATSAQAEEVHEFIRDFLAQNFGKDVAYCVRIQYGGSVTPENIDELMAQPNIDGTLVGGASLKAHSFVRIVNFRRNI